MLLWRDGFLRKGASDAENKKEYTQIRSPMEMGHLHAAGSGCDDRSLFVCGIGKIFACRDLRFK